MDEKSVGQHYRDDLGSRYFAWQAAVGGVGGYLNKWKFDDHIAEDLVVVDFGCGGGDLLAGLKVDRRLGVEPNADARYTAESKGIEVYKVASELPSNIADLVISNHAL